MLKPIVKEKGVNDSERELGNIAESTFLGLWSFPCVYTSEGISKKGTGTELTDLLIYFDNTLIIFSDKNIDFQDRGEPIVAWKRWHKKSVIKSAGQLHGAEKAVRERPKDLFLDKKCTVAFPYDLSSPHLKIHLIAVTYNSATHAKKYFSKLADNDSSSGSLLHFFGLPTPEIIERPFTLNDIAPNKTFVHALDTGSLKLLLKELPSITDFLSYLQAKESAVREKALFMATGEEDILGYYLFETDSRGYGRIEIPAVDPDIQIGIPEGEWKAYKKTVEYLNRQAMHVRSKPWDSILQNFSKSVCEALVGEGAHLPLEIHERAVRSLASENLFARASLATALMEKYASVPTHIRSARLVYSPCQQDRLYIFLMFPRGDLDYSAYREERSAAMQLYGLVAMYKYPGAKQIVVLGADSKGSVGASETLLVIDGSISLTAEGRRDAISVMRKHNILDDMAAPLRRATGIVPMQQVGRNEPCPCNSGLKYKKCCLR